MKKTIILAAALVLVLAGCARGRWGDKGYIDWLVQTPNPLLPNIFVDSAGSATPSGERLIIDQEPIHVHGYDFPVTIRWALPLGSVYQFPDNNALFSLRKDCKEENIAKTISCRVEGTEGKTLGCVFGAGLFESRAKYCYSLTVRNTKTKSDITTDPNMVGD